jgi:hypothetical protein
MRATGVLANVDDSSDSSLESESESGFQEEDGGRKELNMIQLIYRSGIHGILKGASGGGFKDVLRQA